jgi:biopolymer transport protein TolQ
MVRVDRRSEPLNAAKRASARSAALVHRELKRGMDSLATVVSIAPWVGLFGTLVGINNSFPALGTEKSTAMAIIFERLAQALVPCAFGVMVAVVTMLFYKYLIAELDGLDIEMKSASLKLMNTLSCLHPSN